VRALDTNVLVRFLTRDDRQQTERVHALFREAEEKREALFVSFASILETIWALGTIYKVSRAEILGSLQRLLALPYLRFENATLLELLLEESRDSQLRPSDLLIGLIGREHGCVSTLTFDKKAARSPLFTEL
jgi:predicted nucleic-acid-binding protein